MKKNNQLQDEYKNLLNYILSNNLNMVKKYAHAINYEGEDTAIDRYFPTAFKNACENGRVDILKELMKHKSLDNPLELFRYSLALKFSKKQKLNQENKLKEDGVLNVLISLMNEGQKIKAMEFAFYLNEKSAVDMLFDKADYIDIYIDIKSNGLKYDNDNEATIYFMEKFKSMDDKKSIKKAITYPKHIKKKKI